MARGSLSLRRAEAIRAALVAEGIDTASISASGYGATRPLVPTDTAEPQNRRVELILRGGYSREMAACRLWVRDHCITPTHLAHAGAEACNAALTAS